jgi:spermidine synthase
MPRAWTETGIRARMTVAEIDPIVTETAKQDFWFDPGRPISVMPMRVWYWPASATTHDVIIGDAFTDIAVPAHLVTREFFELVASRLNPDGVYLMNIIDHVDGLDALASVTSRRCARFFRWSRSGRNRIRPGRISALSSSCWRATRRLPRRA